MTQVAFSFPVKKWFKIKYQLQTGPQTNRFDEKAAFTHYTRTKM